MSSMAAEEGRYLGGRPPFGYRLVDAGPHPHPSKAADGKRLHRLDIDPVTAPVVERVYREYAAGLGLRSIARELTADGVPSPAAYDRLRNPHRDPTGWAFSAVRAILANPVYRGFATWGKQQKFEELVDPDDVAAGNVTRMRWRPRTEWIEARQPTHPALVSRELAEAVAERLAARSHGRTHSRSTPHPYLLRGVLRCGLCERRMQGSARAGGRILYRCEYGKARSLPVGCEHPPTVYVREDLILGRLDGWLASLATPEALAGVAPKESEVSELKHRLSDINSKLGRLIAAIEVGGAPRSSTPESLHSQQSDERSRVSSPTSATLDHRVPWRFASCCPSSTGSCPCSSQRTRQIGPASTPTSASASNTTLAIERSTRPLISRVS